MSIRVGIIGGGVAGVTSASILGRAEMDVTLFEKSDSLVSGPPFCHLHAGGNLYREISDEQCVTLLRQSIDFAKFYPYVIDYRPTVISVPLCDKGEPKDLINRLELLRDKYNELIKQNPNNKVLGEPDDYFHLYYREDLEKLAKKASLSKAPKNRDEWMIAVAKHLDLEKIKYPLILVNEFGLNLFRLSAGASLDLELIDSVDLKLSCEVVDIKRESNRWIVSYSDDESVQKEYFDYLINATGFKTAEIDEMLGIRIPRMIEFKAAYVTKWDKKDYFPEIIIHGERGTPRGMGQFTPYPGSHFQLHGMTHTITLFPDGLVKSSPDDMAPPLLAKHFIEKIEKGWNWDEVQKRSKRAIEHISEYIPDFITATTASIPLFGAQQIPGSDITKRVAEVSFPLKTYARAEIVKVSSAIDMSKAIIDDMANYGLIDNIDIECNSSNAVVDTELLDKKAIDIAVKRGYPADLAKRAYPKLEF